jgi:AraC-like DNA-binding protein
MGYIADLMHLSRRQMQRRLKMLVGLSPNDYVREIRLHKARKLLEHHKIKTVKELAEAVGYTDPAYFSRLYKMRFGRLPSSSIQA